MIAWKYIPELYMKTIFNCKKMVQIFQKQFSIVNFNEERKCDYFRFFFHKTSILLAMKQIKRDNLNSCLLHVSDRLLKNVIVIWTEVFSHHSFIVGRIAWLFYKFKFIRFDGLQKIVGINVFRNNHLEVVI